MANSTHIYIVCVRKHRNASYYDKMICSSETLAAAKQRMMDLLGNTKEIPEAKSIPVTSDTTTHLKSVELTGISDQAVCGIRLGGVLDDLYFEYYVAKIPHLPQAEHKGLGTTRPAELEKFLKLYH